MFTDTSVEAVSSILNDVLLSSMDNNPVEQPDPSTSGIDTVPVQRSRNFRPPTRLIEESDI